MLGDLEALDRLIAGLRPAVAEASRLVELPLADATLRYFWGCDTALNGIKLADEAVTALAFSTSLGPAM
jgi:hypothetical protein